MRELNLKIEGYEINVPVFQKDGKNWVALRPICEVVGVNWPSQYTKVKANTMIGSCDITTPSNGGAQAMFCIDVDHIGEWIFGINPNKVKPEIKDRMILFRRKLQAVLYAAVTGHIDTNMVQSLVEEIKLLRQTMSTMQERIERQDQLISHLVYQNTLSEKYVDQKLASVGGKLLSSLSHKRRKTPEVL